MQFGVLVEVLCARRNAVWRGGDGRVLGACSLGPGARGHVVWGAGGGAALRDWRPGAGGHAVLGAGGCELDGRVLGGIQLGLLVEVPLCKIGGRALACSLGRWWMLFCKLDGARGHPAWGGAALRDWRPGAGCSLGCWWMLFCELDVGGIQLGLLVEVPLCEIDGRVYGACSLGCQWRCRVLEGMQFGVVVTAGCWGHVVWGRVLGGMWFGALVEVPLCEIGGRVLGGMQFWALVDASLTAGC